MASHFIFINSRPSVRWKTSISYKNRILRILRRDLARRSKAIKIWRRDGRSGRSAAVYEPQRHRGIFFGIRISRNARLLLLD